MQTRDWLLLIGLLLSLVIAGLSAAAETGQVVSFDPQVIGTKSEADCQPVRRLQRRRPGA